MPKMTPAQHALIKQLRKAPNGLPVDIVHSKTLAGLERRGIAERITTTRTVTVELARLVDGSTP